MRSALPNLRPLFKALGLGAVWLWLVQVLGAGLLCFCGHCPTSLALGVRAEPSTEIHACCQQRLAHETKANAGKPSATPDRPCCVGGHELAHGQAELPRPNQTPQPQLLTSDLQGPVLLTEVQESPPTQHAWPWSRGPPGAAAKPLYLQNLSLLI
jgi:hypothetical protein